MSLFNTLITWGLRQALGVTRGGAAAGTVAPIIDTLVPLVLPKSVADLLLALDYPAGRTGAVALINTVINETTRMTLPQKAALKLFVDDLILNGGAK